MKEFLKKLLEKRENRLTEVRTAINASQSVDEVRSLGAEKETLETEISEIRSQIAEIEAEEQRNAGQVPQTGLNPMASYGQQRGQSPQTEDDPFDTVEYRTAFMNYVCRNVPIPTELRANTTTKTTDASAVIPTTILNEIIQKLDSFGNLWAKVRKLNIQGGVEIPISDLKPTAKWITADTGTSESDDQKLSAKTKVSFNYYGVECKIAQTLLANVTTLEMFQQMFVPLATEAIMKAIEIAIMNGSGSGEPLGITKDTRIPTTNVIELTEEEIGQWATWKKKVFAKMKKSYRNGDFIMNQATFDGYVDGMVDANGQPIGRVNYGIDGGETYRFGGKMVETVEDFILPSFDDAETGDVIAVFGQLSDYGVNTNKSLEVVKWTDNDTNNLKNKAIMICDGKLIDPYGFLIIKKKIVSAG